MKKVELSDHWWRNLRVNWTPAEIFVFRFDRFKIQKFIRFSSSLRIIQGSVHSRIETWLRHYWSCCKISVFLIVWFFLWFSSFGCFIWMRYSESRRKHSEKLEANTFPNACQKILPKIDPASIIEQQGSLKNKMTHLSSEIDKLWTDRCSKKLLMFSRSLMSQI